MKLGSALAVAVLALVALGGMAEAQYRWVDPQGRVHYSNVRPATPAPPEATKAPEPVTAPAEVKAPSPDAAKRPADPKALIEEVLDLSGTKKQISQFTAAVQAGLAERKSEMGPADYARASQVIAESYRAEALYQAVVETFKRRYDEGRLLAVAQVFRAPLFKRITQLETQSSAPEAMERIRAFEARLRYDPPSPTRLALVRRLDDVVGATEANLDIMVATVRAIATAVEPTLPPARRSKPGQLEQRLSQMKVQARPHLRNELLVAMLYAYRSLTEGELQEYLAFHESETGRWYTRVSREGALTALTAAADEAGRRIGKAAAATPASHPVPREPNGSPSLPAQKNWALAASALLTERNGQRHDLLGGSDRTEANVTQWKQIMSDWWGINSRADLFMVLKWLDEGGDRQDFEQLAEFSRSLSPAQHKELRGRLLYTDKGAALHQLAMVDRYYEKLGKKSLLGWDYARYISLCRWGYLVGYLSEEETWERIMSAARTLQSAFGSWKDLGDNYLIGLEFRSPQRTHRDGDLYRAAYQKLLSDAGSPWNRYSWEQSLDPAPAKAVKASSAR